MKNFSDYGIWMFLGVVVILLGLAIFYSTHSKAGIFSSRIWTVEEVRATYNTPAKLGQFIRRQFVYTRGIGVKSASEVLRKKEGNCISIITFAKEILEPLGYECEIVADNRPYRYGYSHAILNVRDEDKVWVFSGTDFKRKGLR